MEQNLTDFIKKNDGADTAALLLCKNKYSDIDIISAVKAIDARKTIKEKVPLWFEYPSLRYPGHLPLEQCSSQITAQYKQKYITGRDRVADLTGGLGIDTYFISKKAASVDYFERNQELAQLAEYNFKELGQENISTSCKEITYQFIESIPAGKYDIIYLDPARRGKQGERVFSLKDCEPDLTQLKDILLEKTDRIIVKLSPMADISTIMEQLPQMRFLDIISVGNECKEMLAVIEQNYEGEVLITATDLSRNHQISFTRNQEKNSMVKYAAPDSLSGYIYEPNSSILKGGAFRYISEYFGLEKISHDTHFYIGKEADGEFPGRIGEIIEVIPFSKKNIGTLTEKYEECSIFARNFPIRTEELKKRVRCRESKEIKGLFTTLSDKSKVIIVYRRIFETLFKE